VSETALPLRQQLASLLHGRHEILVFDHDPALAPQFRDVDVVVDPGGAAGTRPMADAATSVQLWQIVGTGFDHFDLDYWQSKHIPVANCPGIFTAVPLAEGAVMFMLMLARRYPVSQQALQEGTMYQTFGRELEGCRLCLIGFGASARQLARFSLAFGMRPSAIDIRDIRQDEARDFGLEVVGKPSDLDRLLTVSDFVSLHLHLNSETHHIIDARRLGLMKPTAFLINVARGALVDEDALRVALVNGGIAGAGLDVFEREPPRPDDPLLHLPNVVSTPHTAAATDGTLSRRAECVAQNIDRIANGQQALYLLS
jgi:D-3-phosphoglycerate dehydrogenase